LFSRVKYKIQSTRNSLSSLHSDCRSRLSAFRLNRSDEDSLALQKNFALVLDRWGIREEQIPHSIRLFQLRILIFALFPASLWAASWPLQPMSMMALALIHPPCLLGILSALWRISVLKNRRFIPFSRWMTGSQ